MKPPPAQATIHASAVLVGDRAVVIRGPSGSGKSHLAFDLICAGRTGLLPNTTLIGDDRIFAVPERGRVVVRHVPELAGLIEIRGLGIRRCAFVPEGVVALIVDLAADDAARLPESVSLKTTLCGAEVARIPVEAGFSALPMVVAWFATAPALGIAPATFHQLPDSP